MKPIYVVLSFECGKWECCYSFGYFTNQKKCFEWVNKLNAEAGKPQFAMNTIYKNEL